MAAALSLPDLFLCERTRTRLTEAGCARMWRSVGERPPAPYETRHACLGCEIGARHAGVSPEAARVAAREAELLPVCARCGAQGRRMIGRLHCVSCYNRAREVRVGCDARGRIPRFAVRFHAVSLVLVLPSSATPAIRRCDDVAGRPEAILLAAKRAAGESLVVGFQRVAGAALPIFCQPEFGPFFAPPARRPGARAGQVASAAPPGPSHPELWAVPCA